MIAPTRSAFTTDLGRRAPPATPLRAWVVTLRLDAATSRPAPRPVPRRLAADLQGLLTDDALVAPLAPASAAAQAFAAGDGFLPGQMIDRAI